MTFFKLVIIIAAITVTGWTAWANVTTETNLAQLSTRSSKPHINHAAISSTALSDKPFLFRTEFKTLKKMSIDRRTDGSYALSQAALWDAGSLLSTKQDPANRTIATYNPLTGKTIPFEFEQLPADIQTRFNLSPGTKNSDGLGAQRVSYLRGNRAMETKNVDLTMPQFRKRDSVLGDIIHSAPVHVGAPAKNGIGTGYSSFYEQHKNRPGSVFVGAHDGMLHAFSADSSVELFAYIPSQLLTKLPRLTDPAFPPMDDVMMDGNIQVREAQVAGQWKTVLAAGMGYGAKGLFALDVTTPEKFMTGKRAIFEFTEKDDADIGYITSAPSIAKISIGRNKNGTPNYRYFVVVTSGDNSSKIVANHGEQYLFLLSLDKDSGTPWIEHSNYYKLSANSNDASAANALTAPGLVLNAQGAAIYAYSGDLQGNVWRFDFTGDKPPSVSPKVIFTAKDRNHHPQSITAQPAVAFAPDGGYLILFGTGENNLRPNSFYALRDTTEKEEADYFITGRSQLAAREVVTSTGYGKSGFQVSGSDFNYSNSTADKKGWYLDFTGFSDNQCGERSISQGELASGSIFFNTVIPGGLLCNENGTSISYAVSATTGKSNPGTNFTVLNSHVGMLGAPLIVTTKSTLGERESTGRRFNTQHHFLVHLGTGGVKGSSEVIAFGKVTQKAGRLSWREIANWQDLKSQW